MIAGIGIDVAEIDRIKRAVEKTPSFINKVLTKGEQAQLATLKNPVSYTHLPATVQLNGRHF